MKVIDPGHVYKLSTLDADVDVTLTFVKREGEKYPGNVGHFPGTTTQEVLRALLDRTRYVDNQITAPENAVVFYHLRQALVNLEERASRLHKRASHISQREAEFGPFCPRCGHVGHICGIRESDGVTH